MAKDFFIIVQLWFPPQVLPVVRVDAPLFVMIVAPRAPGSFEIEHIKVSVHRLDLMNQINRDLVFRMREGAHLTILTVFHIVRVGLAKLTFVFFRMVEFFNSIMGLEALLAK